MSARALLRRSAGMQAAVLATLLLAGCIGGTGTDTDNGIVTVDKPGPLSGNSGTAARVVDADGNPLAGVALSLHTPGFRPDSGAAEILVVDPSQALVTDSQGYARFELLKAGRYVVEGRLAGAAVFFDTLAVADPKTLSAYTFRARPTLAAKGRVRLASGLRVDSGAVFLRGTGRLAPLDTSGAYDLGALPVDFAELAVGLVYHASVREARLAEQRGYVVPISGVADTSRPNYVCREVSADSAARASQPLPDAGTGTIGSPDTARLDTARTAALARSCDSLAGGTVVAVRAPAGTTPELKKDSTTTSYLVVPAATPVESGVNGAKSAGPVTLVPLAACVPAPGTVSTTYDLRVLSSGTGSDLLVGDVADACLAR